MLPAAGWSLFWEGHFLEQDYSLTELGWGWGTLVANPAAPHFPRGLKEGTDLPKDTQQISVRTKIRTGISPLLLPSRLNPNLRFL